MRFLDKIKIKTLTADDTAADLAHTRQQADAIAELKASALKNVGERGGNLTDYYVEAMNLAAEQHLMLTGSMIADLSGQTVNGLTFRADDYTLNNPTDRERVAEAMSKMVASAAQTGAADMRDFYDLDCNGQVTPAAIDAFAGEVGNNGKYEGTNFLLAKFQPASTFHMVHNAPGASFGNITCDGLEGEFTIGDGRNGDSTRGRSNYHNINFTNCEAGSEVIVNKFATVHGLNVEDRSKCGITVEYGAQVNGLHIEGGTVSLTCKPGAILNHPQFNDCTINPYDASSFEGASIRNPQIENVNMARQNFTNARISGGHIKDSDLSGSDFTNASLSDIEISGCGGMKAAYESFKDCASLHNVWIEGQRIDNKDQLKSYAAAEDVVNGKLAGVMASLNTPAEPAKTAANAITGGEHTSLDAQQAAGAQEANTPEQRMALAQAQAAKLERDGSLTVMRS